MSTVWKSSAVMGGSLCNHPGYRLMEIENQYAKLSLRRYKKRNLAPVFVIFYTDSKVNKSWTLYDETKANKKFMDLAFNKLSD